MATTPTGTSVDRREFFRLAGGVLALEAFPVRAQGRSEKKVVVAGAGIAGLSCAYELMKRGHDVIVLEASNRTGGHVLTVRDELAEDLYADGGAENFTKPGYDIVWAYTREFNLTVLPYPNRERVLRWMGEKMYTEQQLTDPQRWAEQGFSGREMQYMKQHGWWSLQGLYFNAYADSFQDEYQPFGVGLDHLDNLTVTELLEKDGASPAAVRRVGSRSSALHVIWKSSILKSRGHPSYIRDTFRIKGGNQRLTDALATRLDSRIRRNSPVTSIRHSDRGVTVGYRDKNRQVTMDCDYLVCCMSAVLLRQISVTPPWPERKQFAIQQMPYTISTRPIFQSRTKFWKRDGLSGNLNFSEPELNRMWPMAEEVPTERGLLIGTAQVGTTAQQALSVFHRLYPGQAEDIDHTTVVDWSKDKWSSPCETRTYRPGQLRKFWPAVIQPVGRVYFAGAYCDNQSWGMEAATRSAHRVANAIDAMDNGS